MKNSPDRAFATNWERSGFKSAEEGMAHVLRCLQADLKKILKRSVSKDAVFILGDRIITFS